MFNPTLLAFVDPLADDPPAHDPQEDEGGEFIDSTYPGPEQEVEEDQPTPDTTDTGKVLTNIYCLY